MTSFNHISVEDTAKLLEQGAVIVDVRDDASFSQGHIPKAIHLDNHSVASFMQQADLDKPTIVVCYHGHASQSAAAYLHSQDFSEVYSMDGGFTRWSQVFPEQVQTAPL